MMYPGLPFSWIILTLFSVLGLMIWTLYVPYRAVSKQVSPPALPDKNPAFTLTLFFFGWPQRMLKLLLVVVFVLIIVAGLYGTAVPSENISTLLTWNLWWSGLVVSVFFLGSAWCAVCPWNTLAGWLARLPLVGGGSAQSNRLNLRVPEPLRSVWPALALFVGLTWLELGAGITTNPYVTALVALLMLLMAIIFAILFERKAFCRYFCPVGRTIGFYSQLAPVELRHRNATLCLYCTSLDCYYGTEHSEPCPTGLTMKNLRENTYCTSCGSCVHSCPHQNITWRLRPMSQEAIQDARPRQDEAWFMLGLLALTGLHGLTMVPVWEQKIRLFAHAIGDSGQLLWSFSVGLLVTVLLVVLLYYLLIISTWFFNKGRISIPKLFSGFSFIALPLAFSYHLAHNINHLLRESSGLGLLFTNPLGTNITTHKLATLWSFAIPQNVLYAVQSLLLVFGFWIAMRVITYRGEALLPGAGLRLAPMYLFALLVTLSQLWLLSQPMMMRF